MKLSLNWLHELVPLKASPHEYIAAMTMSGSKVETLTYLGEEIRNVVVGRLLSVSPHPHADRLVVCSVDVGGKRPLQIVTGAKNVAAGDLVPVALDGSTLPGGVEIRTGELRGVLSEGMLCSHQELGLSEHDVPGAPEHGILILSADEASVGQDIRRVLGFDDYVVDFEITPNRPDCLSVIGLARESAATYGLSFTPASPAVRAQGAPIGDAVSVRVENTALCPRYTARLVRNVKIAPSPKWLRERLRASGVRPINNIVDITNYVMLEYGQPLHAFDYACLADGRIVVRTARPGETLDTLDGQKRKLDENMLVIADSTRPVGVAGVMGGANSEITEGTRDVVFESANFSGVSIRLTARRLGMRTEASGRFEKGLDPRNTLPAADRACELVELLGAGEVAQGCIDVDGTDRTPRRLPLEPDRVNRFLGTQVPEAQMVRSLTLLGFQVENGLVTVPSWRADVEQFADLAEEVARMYGYDKIPTTLFSGAAVYRASPRIAFEDRLRELCLSLGFDEAMTYSFVSPKSFDRVRLPAESSLRRALTIANPLSDEMSVMRTTPLASMAEVLSRNYNMKNPTARLFELAKIYLPELRDGRPDLHTLPQERKILTLGLCGEADFYDLKGAVESLAAALRLPPLCFEAERENPSYHPGRCACVYAETPAGDGKSGSRTLLGVLGQLHPLTAENFGTDAPLFAAELSVDALFAQAEALHLYQPLPKFPGATRDLAVVCDEKIPAAAVEACIREGAGAYLESLQLFDVYRGAQLGADQKSLAFALVLRAKDRTLTDTDADAAVGNAVRLLSERLGAVLRS